MKSLLAVFICALVAVGGVASAEDFQVASPIFDLRINDVNDGELDGNWNTDGSPKSHRWGFCVYQVEIADRAGDYKARWKWTRPANHPSPVMVLDFNEDRALPEEGVYDLSISVLNVGVENGTVVTKSTPGALAIVVNYAKPEIPLVTPSDLKAAMISIVEHETQF